MALKILGENVWVPFTPQVYNYQTNLNHVWQTNRSQYMIDRKTGDLKIIYWVRANASAGPSATFLVWGIPPYNDLSQFTNPPWNTWSEVGSGYPNLIAGPWGLSGNWFPQMQGSTYAGFNLRDHSSSARKDSLAASEWFFMEVTMISAFAVGKTN